MTDGTTVLLAFLEVCETSVFYLQQRYVAAISFLSVSDNVSNEYLVKGSLMHKLGAARIWNVGLYALIRCPLRVHLPSEARIHYGIDETVMSKALRAPCF